MPLSNEEIARLLATTSPQEATYEPLMPAHIQRGPLRWYDKEMRCALRGCTSPTYCRINGIPRCMIHALHDLNELLLAFEGVAPNDSYVGIASKELHAS